MQQVLANRLVIEMAKVLDREAEVEDFREENASLVPWINRYLWDEKSGFYHDLDRDQSRITGVKTIGAYWALLADAVPRERLDRFVAHLANENEFKRVHRIPSLSADTEGYDPDGGLWLGGVWAPINYMVLSGLSRHGYNELAFEIAQNHFEHLIECFKKTGSIWEHFAPDARAEGRGRKDFVGWTGITPIAVFFEYVIGLRADPGARRITWDLLTTDEIGVDRYPFGRDGTVELRALARGSVSDEPVVKVQSNVPFDLVLRWRGGSRVERIVPGAENAQ
jgi:hypothetical protein